MDLRASLYSRLCMSPVARLARLRNQTMAIKYSKYNLTGSQVGILQNLYDNSGCIQKDICEAMSVAPSALVRTLDSLEKLGYVERVRSAENRSTVNVYITELGIKVAEEIQTMVVETEYEYLSELSPVEKDQLRYLLTKAFLSWFHTAEKNNDTHYSPDK